MKKKNKTQQYGRYGYLFPDSYLHTFANVIRFELHYTHNGVKIMMQYHSAWYAYFSL